MPRSVFLFAVVLVGCGRTESTSSAPPPASASIAPLASAAPSARPAPSAAPADAGTQGLLPGFPDHDGACQTDADCAAAYFDDLCCRQCEARVGNKAWVKKVGAFCSKARDAGTCPPRACSFTLGAARCRDGSCGAR